MTTPVQRIARDFCASAWAFALALAAAGEVRANGAFPDDFSIHFQPNAPSRILIGANFGLLISDDEGATWRYSCEPWIVAGSSAPLGDVSVSFYQVTADGALLAQSVNMTRSADVACTWPLAKGALEGQLITDTFASPTDATVVLATVAIAGGSYIVASHDGGRTFDPTRLYETGDLLSGVEISRSNPAVIYATVVSTFGTASRLVVSRASGAVGSWVEHAIPAPDGTQPRILGVDPVDENKVYVRLLTGVTDAIAITADGGQTFESPNPLSITGQLSSFLRASDGTLYAGTPGGVLYERPPGGSFAQRTGQPHFRCLGQRPGTTRIYACADSIVDGNALYASDDAAISFRPVMKFTDLQGPLTCQPVQSNCAAHWERIQGVLGLGPRPPTGSSHCSSLGADATALLVLVTFSLRRPRS